MPVMTVDRTMRPGCALGVGTEPAVVDSGFLPEKAMRQRAQRQTQIKQIDASLTRTLSLPPSLHALYPHLQCSPRPPLPRRLPAASIIGLVWLQDMSQAHTMMSDYEPVP